MSTAAPGVAVPRADEEPGENDLDRVVHRAARLQPEPPRRFGAPVGFIDPDTDDSPLIGHLWLLSWVLVAALGAVVITPPASSLAIWWPATFVSVGVLLTAPRRRWPALVVVLAATISLGQLLGGRAVDLSVGLGVLTALESGVVTAVLRGRGLRALTSGRDIGRLLAASAAGFLVFALGLMVLMVLMPQDDYLTLVGQTGLSHVTAALCLGPLFMTRPDLDARISHEQVVQWILLILVELWIFGTEAGGGVMFALLPVLLWGAVRQSPRTASIQSTTVAAVAVLLFSVERGPFSVGPGQSYPDWPTATIALQLFLSAAALTSLVVSTAGAQQRQTAEDARREAEFTRTVLSTTDALTLVVDADGRVELVNGAAERMTGWRAQDLLGRPLWERLVPEDRREETQRAFALSHDPAQVDLGTEQELLTRSGRVRRVRLSTSILDRGPGKPRSVVVTGIDVTDERVTSDLLSRMLQASSSTAAIGVDLAGSITVFSRGASEMLGYEPHEAQGSGFTTLIAAGTCDGTVEVDPTAPPGEEIARLVDRLGGGADRAPQDCWWRCADGELIAVSQTLDAVTDGFGRTTGYLVIARDVTEERRSQEILLAALRRERQAVERLRGLDAAKSEFVTTVSHELRTPVTSIVGYAEVLREEVSDPHVRSLVDAMARNGYRLRDLADDLVTLSDLEHQGVSGSGPVDLRLLLGDVVDACRDLAAARGQDIDLADETCPEVDCLVEGERDHVERALRNVIDNALKFSPSDATVRVALSTRGTALHVRVVDRGTGIAADEVDQVFGRFFRGRNAHENATQGPGLGLSLAETITRLHGGGVRLSSLEGAGTEVEIELPMRRPPRTRASGPVDG